MEQLVKSPFCRSPMAHRCLLAGSPTNARAWRHSFDSLVSRAFRKNEARWHFWVTGWPRRRFLPTNDRLSDVSFRVEGRGHHLRGPASAGGATVNRENGVDSVKAGDRQRSLQGAGKQAHADGGPRRWIRSIGGLQHVKKLSERDGALLLRIVGGEPLQAERSPRSTNMNAKAVAAAARRSWLSARILFFMRDRPFRPSGRWEASRPTGEPIRVAGRQSIVGSAPPSRDPRAVRWCCWKGDRTDNTAERVSARRHSRGYLGTAGGTPERALFVMGRRRGRSIDQTPWNLASDSHGGKHRPGWTPGRDLSRRRSGRQTLAASSSRRRGDAPPNCLSGWRDPARRTGSQTTIQSYPQLVSCGS